MWEYRTGGSLTTYWGGCYVFFYKQPLPFLLAAAFSIQMAQPHANARQDSRATGQSAQASEEGRICSGGDMTSKSLDELSAPGG